MKKLITALILALVIISVLPSANAESTGIKPYKGYVNANSPFYSIKLWLQQLDESITGDMNEKLQKKIAHADERLAEAAAMVEENNDEALQNALEQYELELQEINETMEAPEVGEEEYSDVANRLEQQADIIEYLISLNLTNETQKALDDAYESNQQIKYGRPFVYYEGNTYFIPPGQWRNFDPQTGWKVPPGLAKKGIKALPISNGSPITNGSIGPMQYDYSYSYNSKGPHNSKNANGKNK